MIASPLTANARFISYGVYNDFMKRIGDPGVPVPAIMAEQESRETYIARIQKFIEERAEAYRAEGIPVADDGRIDPNPPDEAEIWGRKLVENTPHANTQKKEIPTPTEQVELLSLAIFAKNLPQNEFVIARSSQQDNLKDRVSTLILERRTGNLVCAFSEVGANDNEEYREETGKKAVDISKLNLQGGASFDHGIIKNDDGAIAISEVENVPVFYLALPPRHLYDGLKSFLPRMEQSEVEKRLFVFFVATINKQIAELGIKKEQLNRALAERLASFQKTIEYQKSREDLPSFKNPLK